MSSFVYIIVIKIINQCGSFDNKVFIPKSNAKYILSFLVMVESLRVPVIPRAKPSGVLTPVGTLMVAGSRRIG